MTEFGEKRSPEKSEMEDIETSTQDLNVPRMIQQAETYNEHFDPGLISFITGSDCDNLLAKFG